MGLEDEIRKLIIEIQKLNLLLSKNKESINVNDTPLTLTISNFCKKINVSKAMFYKTIKNHPKFKIIKIGRRSLVSKDMADTWINEIMNGAG